MAGIAAAIAAEAAAKHCRTVLLYIHGFNTAFYSALGRAGQLGADTEAPCALAAFSWSSEGNVKRYAADIEHSTYAEPLLEAFLKDLAATGLRVDVVAHSMGDRLVLTALSAFAGRGDAVPENFIGELVLAAADVGVEPVNDDFLHLLRNAAAYAKRITVYASAGDAVLVVSRTAHGGVPRAGREPLSGRQYQTPANAPVSDHIVDVIDASDAPGDSLGHSYYALSYEMIEDIALVLADVPAKDRLAPRGGWPATLECADACKSAVPVYTLSVAGQRKPSLISRATRALVPLIPWL
jgi:esterase/lipase superfamily enzyme